MSKDTIYREDAIKAINARTDWYQVTCNGKQVAVMLMAKDVNEVLEKVPSADRPQEWIPCSERLPKESGEYLVYCEIFFIPDHVDEPSSRKGMAIAYYHREFNEWLGEDKVYAWMPLPKPYEEVKENE